MKKLSLSLLTLSALFIGSATFAQDSVKHSMKVKKVTTHKVTKHKVAKKSAPAM